MKLTWKYKFGWFLDNDQWRGFNPITGHIRSVVEHSNGLYHAFPNGMNRTGSFSNLQQAKEHCELNT